MTRNKKQRIDTDPPANSGFSPFAALDMSGLKDLPASPAAEPANQPSAASPAPHDGKKPRLVLRKETAHRSGKAVIVVDGFPAQTSHGTITALASQLRKACGCGGTVRNQTIEIQGIQVKKIRTLLKKSGYRIDGVK